MQFFRSVFKQPKRPGLYAMAALIREWPVDADAVARELSAEAARDRRKAALLSIMAEIKEKEERIKDLEQRRARVQAALQTATNAPHAIGTRLEPLRAELAEARRSEEEARARGDRLRDAQREAQRLRGEAQRKIMKANQERQEAMRMSQAPNIGNAGLYMPRGGAQSLFDVADSKFKRADRLEREAQAATDKAYALEDEAYALQPVAGEAAQHRARRQALEQRVRPLEAELQRLDGLRAELAKLATEADTARATIKDLDENVERHVSLRTRLSPPAALSWTLGEAQRTSPIKLPVLDVAKLDGVLDDLAAAKKRGMFSDPYKTEVHAALEAAGAAWGDATLAALSRMGKRGRREEVRSLSALMSDAWFREREGRRVFWRFPEPYVFVQHSFPSHGEQPEAKTSAGNAYIGLDGDDRYVLIFVVRRRNAQSGEITINEESVTIERFLEIHQRIRVPASLAGPARDTPPPPRRPAAKDVQRRANESVLEWLNRVAPPR